MTMHDLKNRLETIESQLAFQEDALEQFNAVVVGQQRQLEELRVQLRYLQEQLKELPDSSLDSQIDSEQEKPPHY
ncbi:MAG TPA: SlyX protein [Gammaproteobacteria bacterium]|nr:SlyX protein [Gammaproteobacteria bacterium]|tara:strand:+ start:2535 stop:2759 length:225 start_codon:yes stop_codon:yes gene_type:complete